MNLINITLTVVFATVLLGNLLANDTLQVDLENSQISWVGRKVTGEHNGTLNLSSGWVVMNKTNLIGGKFIFDMTSITNTDKKGITFESPEWKQKLENHLKGKDFFYVDSFPQAILEIKQNQLLPDSTHILADLTIRGVTHEINLPYVLTQDVNYFIANGIVNVDRTLYNIQYQSGKFFEALGDKLIYDDFTVQFMVKTEVNKQ